MKRSKVAADLRKFISTVQNHNGTPFQRVALGTITPALTQFIAPTAQFQNNKNYDKGKT